MQYDEGLRMAMVLKFLEYISNIKIKRSGPSSGSLHEKKCIVLSVLNNRQTEIVTKALDGQRYPCPYVSICGCVMIRGAAAPMGPMTYAK